MIRFLFPGAEEDRSGTGQILTSLTRKEKTKEME